MTETGPTSVGPAESLSTAVAIARALGHPARMRIIAMLRTGEMCVCQITEVLGLAGSTVSIHLGQLRRCGLVSERKDGRWVWISPGSEPAARAWIETALAGLDDDQQLRADLVSVSRLRELPVEDLCRLGYEAARARAEARATRNGR